MSTTRTKQVLCEFCPAFCHRCADLCGEIMPHCWGMINARDYNFDGCTCENMLCATCGAPAEFRCTWPDTVRIEKQAGLANLEDIWITEKKGKRGHIVGIERFIYNNVGREMKPPPGHEACIWVRIWVLIPGHPDAYPYVRFNSQTFTTEAEFACGQPACERHLRELDDGVVICADHWRAQLAAIA